MIDSVLYPLRSLFELLRKPEWVAAVALLIQAVILFTQAWILHRHAETMEKHKEIARTQANTAELIGTALQQQAKILSDQGKIMAEQLELQRRMAAQAEREKVFGVVLELRSRVVVLVSALSAASPPGTTISLGTREKQESSWSSLEAAILPCQKAMITSIHLSQDEKNYFLRYAQAVDAAARSRNVQALQALDDNYKDFAKVMMTAAQTPKSS
jgi:hypothetical protein